MKAKRTFYSERIYPLLFMFAVTFFCILLTSGLHLATQDKAITNERSFTRRAILNAGGVDFENTTEGIEEAYQSKIEEKDGYYVADSENGKRYIIPVEGMEGDDTFLHLLLYLVKFNGLFHHQLLVMRIYRRRCSLEGHPLHPRP